MTPDDARARTPSHGVGGGSARRRLPGIVLWLLGLSAIVLPSLAEARSLDLEGTPWVEAARPHGFAPELLYAVTLVESQRGVGSGHVAPWPWTLRTPEGGEWFDSADAAAEGLAQARKTWPANRIDVGVGQVNLGWHAERFERPEDLLDPAVNLNVAAGILADAIASTRDPVIAVGRYHHWRSEKRARAYGERVWKIYRNIHFGDGDYLFATGGLVTPPSTGK
jgi:hypothetical protein